MSKQAVFKPPKAIRWGHASTVFVEFLIPCGNAVEWLAVTMQGWRTRLLSSVRRVWAPEPAWLCTQLRVQRRQQQLRLCYVDAAAQPGAAQVVPSRL